MAKLVILDFKTGGRKAKKPGGVGEKRVRDASSGKFLTVRTIDATSKTFGSDLTYVFTKNVAKARRENKQVTGTTDRAPGKS